MKDTHQLFGHQFQNAQKYFGDRIHALCHFYPLAPTLDFPTTYFNFTFYIFSRFSPQEILAQAKNAGFLYFSI